MASGKTRILVHFTLQSDRVLDFIREANRLLVEPTRGEPGCLAYDLCQDQTDPARFALVAEWESEAALNAHLAQESLHATVAKLRSMMAEAPRVQQFRSVS
jgi:quinol monooxygenase YgiN